MAFLTKNIHGEKPLIMIIDDTLMNLQILGTILYEVGCETIMAESGKAALELLKSNNPDLILLDIIMPGMDGYEICRRIKKIDRIKNIPIIFITTNSNNSDLLKGFEVGGVDYITKPLFQKELLARIKTHIDLKFSIELVEQKIKEISSVNKQLTESNEMKDKYLGIINFELNKAAEYVISLLPEPIKKGDVTSNWLHIPSSQLGGDCFGHHWIDADNFAIYLLDVSGHGVGPALHSVSVLNILRFSKLPNTDLRKPEEVLKALNKSFQMSDHNEMFFTIWYGVHNRNTNKLTFATAGHPPGVLINDSGELKELKSPNSVIGFFDDMNYISDSIIVDQTSDLFVFSDGAYEIKNQDGEMIWDVEKLFEYLVENNSKDVLNKLYSYIQHISGNDNLDDDFSIMHIHFK